MPAVAATPTRNSTVPAANKNPMNRTRKRISEYPFQPLRRPAAFSGQARPAGRRIFRFCRPFRGFYRTGAVAKLGLAPLQVPPFQFAAPADTIRLAKKVSIACATDPTVLDRQWSDCRCSRSLLLET